MNFWVVMGALVGGILGAMGAGAGGATIVGLLGAGIGWLVARSIRSSASAHAGTDAPPPAPPYGRTDMADADATGSEASPASTPALPHAAPTPGDAILQRLERIDARLARIEARLAGPAAVPAFEPPAATAERDGALEPRSDPLPLAAARDVRVVEPSLASLPFDTPIARSETPVPVHPIATATEARTEAPPQPFTRAPDGTLQPSARPPERAHAAAADAAGVQQPPPRPDYSVRVPASGEPASGEPNSRDAAAREPSPLWRWITGGNALTRIGIVILFFGVAFLLVYFAEVVTIPIELKLAGAGAGGVLLAALGVALGRRRPAYGLSLQGAGMGIVYLVVFAAFRLYEVLAPAPAIALLVVVAATTIALALRHDSQPLAALALAGGFMAPVLIRTDATNPALLFGYFAILNAVVFVLAWRRAWRPLNVLGFVFTFALGLLWGYRFYTPAHYATVQPFLALFFLFYVAIAVLYARREPLQARAPVDGLLVFGVPIVGFALQMAIVRGHRYGVAWSAGALCAFYGALWAWLRTRTEPGLGLLARAFGVLAVMFGTLAIPFAADPRVTSAWWAIEAAAVYWIAAVQRRPVARAFALLLEIAAAVAFLIDVPQASDGRWFLNAGFLGTALIGLAAIASTWAGDRHSDSLGPRERALMPWLFLWGVAWWIFGGIDELRRQLDAEWWGNAALAWVALSTAAGFAAHRWLRWPRAAWVGVLLLPTMLIVGFRLVDLERTTLTHLGWIVWPCAFVLQWLALRVNDGDGEDAELRVRADFARLAHIVSAIGLVAWVSWEASEWIGRTTPRGTVWVACVAVLPSIAYLFASPRWREASRWPFDRYGETYGHATGTALAALVVVWFVMVNLTSPGNASPLPYLPVANPLDLVLVAALFSLVRWSQTWGRVAEATRYRALAAAAFLALNGTVVRAAHHWGDVRWRLDALVGYRPLQAALTLTWTVTALALMLWATRKAVRVAWMAGAALLAVVIIKLFVVDLAALSGLTRVIAFMGVGALLLVIGYVAPLPPAPAEADAKSSRQPEAS